jgi:hypothetical protein
VKRWRTERGEVKGPVLVRSEPWYDRTRWEAEVPSVPISLGTTTAQLPPTTHPDQIARDWLVSWLHMKEWNDEDSNAALDILASITVHRP